MQAPAPELPVHRGRAGAGLLAHVAVAKYCDHQPLHRQAEQYARADIDLSRSTLADMVGQTAALLRPLVDALERHVLRGERLYADDTTVAVLATLFAIATSPVASSAAAPTGPEPTETV